MSAEFAILTAIEELITGRCAEILTELEDADGQHVFLLELPSEPTYGRVRLPQLKLAITSTELTEKDRIIKNERYLVTLSITVEGERPAFQCYRYADALGRALREDLTLGGIAATVFITKKDYRFPTVEHSGEPYRVVLSLAVVRESL